MAGVDRRTIGPRETLVFRQEVRGAKDPWRFPATNMSDGTLRALGVLAALFQGFAMDGADPRLVGIEEPEIALHPAAAGVLVDGIRDAAERAQVLVTSHSPDLLDNDEISADSIVAVVLEHGETRIGPLDEVGRSALRKRLYTAGELLRMNQLDPDPGGLETDHEADQPVRPRPGTRDDNSDHRRGPRRGRGRPDPAQAHRGTSVAGTGARTASAYARLSQHAASAVENARRGRPRGARNRRRAGPHHTLRPPRPNKARSRNLENENRSSELSISLLMSSGVHGIDFHTVGW